MQRRADSIIDQASALPPEVVSVLSQCDALESHREESNNECHYKLSETIERFFSKLDAEEKKFNTRMSELEAQNLFF